MDVEGKVRGEMGREKDTKWWSDTGRGVTVRFEGQQHLVNTRSSRFPAL